MRESSFQWDSEKNRLNQAKHGIAFEDAVRVFDTPDTCIELFDEAHSHHEERFITIGPVRDGLALVVWTERQDNILRIISARWANRTEQRLYRRHMEKQL